MITHLPRDQAEVWLARKATPPMTWREITRATGKTRAAVKTLYAKADAKMTKAA